MQLDSFLPQGRVPLLTGLLADPEDVDELMHLLWAARLSRNFAKTIALLSSECILTLPPDREPSWARSASE